MSLEFVASLIPSGVVGIVALYGIQKVVDAIRVSKYGPAIAAALKALSDGEITKEEFDEIKSKL